MKWESSKWFFKTNGPPLCCSDSLQNQSYFEVSYCINLRWKYLNRENNKKYFQFPTIKKIMSLVIQKYISELSKICYSVKYDKNPFWYQWKKCDENQIF
jgi:hypothetical protein